ncbi:response regulator [Phycisphaerales bacterium AB-hyl4]|uniref:Response regulator n=1 Tax=Natronomicrosphaera hydrolytica TaxID=3242702 RepID=A0ABV4U2R7_9BACT
MRSVNPPRFNVLLTQDRDHAIEHWTRQLPRLLEPQGVHAHLARTGREAVDLATRLDVHAAVVDLLTPADDMRSASRDPMPGGLWLLQVLRRKPNRPPVVVVANDAYTLRQAQRFLNEALRLGAFSVINRPVDLDPLLQVIRRLIDRRYAGAWPAGRTEPNQSNDVFSSSQPKLDKPAD